MYFFHSFVSSNHRNRILSCVSVSCLYLFIVIAIAAHAVCTICLEMRQWQSTMRLRFMTECLFMSLVCMQTSFELVKYNILNLKRKVHNSLLHYFLKCDHMAFVHLVKLSSARCFEDKMPNLHPVQ